MLTILILVLISSTTQAEDSSKIIIPDNIGVELKPVSFFAENDIEIIYPKDSQLVRAIDSTFILGNVKYPNVNQYIIINDVKVKVHEDGGFLAYLPVVSGMFTFLIEYNSFDFYYVQTRSHVYINKEDKKPGLKFRNFTVQIPEPLTPIPYDSLVIVKEINRPSGYLNLNSGDRIQVSFQGTPNCIATFSIQGIADSIAMAETSPCPQPYWGESVFGVGAVPDSLLLRGIYTGYYDIPLGVQADSIQLIYMLKYRPIDSLREHLLDSTGTSVLSMHKADERKDDTATMKSSYKLSINSNEFPFTVRFKDSVQTIRHGARKGYFSIFQPEGVEAFVTGSEGDWYIAELTKNHKAFINKHSVEKLPQGILPPHSYLTVIRTKGSDDNVKIEFPLSGKHPFKIIQEDKRTLKVQLFGVTTDTDWIRYDFSDKLIDIATWSQPSEKLYELKIKLTKDLWGYDSYYEGNTFYLKLNKAPSNVKKLKNKIIVIDPGHSSDKGSVGPTGYTEAEANLGISLELRKQLESKGATVLMTRDDNSNVDLYDRPSIAKAANADLFISMHNNALPDGVNPFTHNGSSTYYYHPHSINLAKNIQAELTKATKLSDYGLYHGNLAVNRPTQYPAVLIESAFMIIPEQEALLKTKKFRKKVAKGIVKGIENFLKEYEKSNRK